MILSADLMHSPEAGLALAGVLSYLVASWQAAPERRWPIQAGLAAWGLHGMALLAGLGNGAEGWRIGFAPALSFTLWLVVTIYGIESRLVPVAGARRILALLSAAAMVLAWMFPGEARVVAHSPYAPLHWVLGLSSYGLFGAAVVHALMLDTADRRMRDARHLPSKVYGMPLLKLERLTFRFVEAGFVVLTAALLLGMASPNWRWLEHKTLLSVLGWATVAALLGGRLWRGWRGRQATRWLYAGSLLLLLAYVGSRFVLEVLLHRSAG